MQDHYSLKYSFKTPNLGQEEVYSVLYRSIEISSRLDKGLFKYDPGKATSPPRLSALGERLLTVIVLRIWERERSTNFAR